VKEPRSKSTKSTRSLSTSFASPAAPAAAVVAVVENKENATSRVPAVAQPEKRLYRRATSVSTGLFVAVRLCADVLVCIWSYFWVVFS
jgi:hypothetical protein